MGHYIYQGNSFSCGLALGVGNYVQHLDTLQGQGGTMRGEALF